MARPSYFDPSLPASTRPDFFDRNGAAWLPIGCFVIREPGERVILVDAGLGPSLHHLPDGMLLVGGQLLTGLHALGIEVDHIGDVVCTHLHADHVGWLFNPEGEAVFPAATLWVGAADLDLVLDGTLESAPHIRQGFQHHAGTSRLRTMDAETVVGPSVTALAAPGHTPGSFVLEVSLRNRRLLLLGDAITCPIQYEQPDWHSFGDMNVDQAHTTRADLWHQLSGTDTLAVGSHFPALRAGRLGAPRDGHRSVAALGDDGHSRLLRWIDE